MALWRVGRKQEAARAAEKALELEPDNARLRRNVEFFAREENLS